MCEELPPHEVEVEYPYLVPYPYGGADSSESTLEEIDGFVRVGYLSSLIQSKNYDKKHQCRAYFQTQKPIAAPPVNDSG